MGSTRAKTRAEKSGMRANCPSSLLPVVRRMFPWVPARYSAAAGTSGTYTAPSAVPEAGRRRRRYSVPVSSQARAMFSVTMGA